MSAPARVGSLWHRYVRSYAPAALIFILFLVLWELAVIVFQIKGFLLPRPSAIWEAYLDNRTVVWNAGYVTLQEALGGLILGSLLGTGMALATARWTTVREGLLPFAVAINSAPIIALAPIFNAWFGASNPLSKMAVVTVMVFFPVMINMVRGLAAVASQELELLRSYAAGPREILRKLRIPNSLPYLFSALKVVVVLAMIGAIVAEYFGGAVQTLGVFISQQAANTRFAQAWSGIIVGSLMGIGLYLLVVLVERRVMPWHVSLRGPGP
ncbi:MAG TPA: ABC transporter permease [Acidimicrobiia bacterium]